MRYPQGGGLTPERQAFRERIRMEVAERFGAGASSAEVAKNLRVSMRSVQRWRRVWQDAGTDGLRSAGPVSLPKLSEKLFAVLEQELAKGPVAHGWPEQPMERRSGARADRRFAFGRRDHARRTWRGTGKATPPVLPTSAAHLRLLVIRRHRRRRWL
ncbi:helix-turn-helix domain-containing protein [Streptomyces sp. NPDC127066]|uniref:helix-turn-helix domain-containing protein n=1 Tax=Streptomyces sp. NPDC127066 TaxID=3347125 RepID=UPI003662BF5D